MVIVTLQVVLCVYTFMVLIPFVVFVAVGLLQDTTPNRVISTGDIEDGDSISKSGKQIKSFLVIRLSLYIVKFPVTVCLYHCLLTCALTIFCANEITHNLDIAVDMNYYTKTTIRDSEVNTLLMRPDCIIIVNNTILTFFSQY
jgi:hypothetical protein